MTSKEILLFRLMSQQIAHQRFTSATNLVSWMGAVQAQDYNMAKWAIGLRIPGATEQTINKAFDDGAIIRTHAMRGTWHIVAAADIHWMLALTAPRILQKLKTRQKQLELTDAILKKSNKVIEQLLSKTKHATRDEMVAALKHAKVPVDEQRASHLLLYAELHGLICSGAHKEKDTTYTLLHHWAPEKKTLSREEALAKLAHTYFNSHGPATVQDFIWWSGASIAEGKQALELVKHHFIIEKNGPETWVVTEPLATLPKLHRAAYLLPAFDEFVISYKNRSNIMAIEHHEKAFSSNGIFWPVVVVNEKVTGLWKRSVVKDKVVIETTPFKRTAKTDKPLIAKAAAHFGRFLNRTPEIIHG